MKISVYPTPEDANEAATELLGSWLALDAVRNVMLAAGNTPLALYQKIAERKLTLKRLNIFALDEYAGVPRDEPRNCANLIRRTAVAPWGIPPAQYFTVCSEEPAALPSVLAHERRVVDDGGLDVVILGLGQNAHLGFNEPGSREDSEARVIELDEISVAANRAWFSGDYAPSRGVTVGMKTILAGRRILLLAFGAHKADAVLKMVQGPRTTDCPASLLQGHREVNVILDRASSELLSK